MHGSVNPLKVYGLTKTVYNLFNLIMKQINLQCLYWVEPTDASGTSKIKSKLGLFCI